MLYALICTDKPGALPARKANRPQHLDAGDDSTLPEIDGLIMKRLRRFHHCVRPVSDDDPAFFALAAIGDDRLTVRVRHLQAVHHHQRPDRHGHARPAEPQHLRDVRVT